MANRAPKSLLFTLLFSLFLFTMSVSLADDAPLLPAPLNPRSDIIRQSNGTFHFWQDLTINKSNVGSLWGVPKALDGNTAMLTVYDLEANTSSVYVYSFASGVWEFEQELRVIENESGDDFGREIALQGDTALISVVGFESGTWTQGSVYVFTRTNGIWTEHQKLVASDGKNTDGFGVNVELEGDHALISAPRTANSNGTYGSVYAFTRSNGIWTEQQKLTDADGAPFNYGYAMALDGNTAFIGSYSEYASFISGKLHIFTLVNGVWSLQQTIDPNASTDSNARGWYLVFADRIALDGDTALISSLEGFHAEVWVDVYTRIDNVWTYQETIFSGASVGGRSIELDGDTVLITADIINEQLRRRLGRIFVYKRDNDNWSLQQEIVPDPTLYYSGLTKLDGDTFFYYYGLPNSETSIDIIYVYKSDVTLYNGSFEGDKVAGIPVGWVGKDTTIPNKDKQKCDQPDKNRYFSYKGDCAFMFKGNPNGTTSMIKQRMRDVTIIPDGSTVFFSAYIDNRTATAGRPVGKLIIKYSDNDKDKLILRIPDTDSYTMVSDSVDIDLTGRTLELVKAQFRNRLTSGKYFIDDANLTVTPATTTLRTEREVVPLPDVPGGFRD